MVRSKLLLLLPFVCIMVLQGCVHGDLDDCPPMVNYAVAFQFTHHMYNADRFYDDVKKINLYVFDENNFFYTTTTDVGPYEQNFNVPLELPMGKYHIIAWGNVLDSGHVSIAPSTFQKGITRLQDARLILEREANNSTHFDLEKIFYGDAIVDVPMYLSRIDTIPLINNTHNVRVVLHWDHTGNSRSYTGGFVEYEDINVNLHGSNAVYFFNDRDIPATDPVTYDPYFIDTTGNILRTNILDHELNIYYYPNVDSISTMDSTVYDFKVLRLCPDNLLKLTIIQTSPVGGFENLFAPIGSAMRRDIDYGADIVGSSSGNAGFAELMRLQLNVMTGEEMQSTFDRYENYRVNVLLKYSPLANTYFATTSIKIQDWHTSEDDIIL